MRDAGARAMARCIAPGAAFADRGSAAAWAHALTGKVAVEARAAPSPAVARARAWAAARLEDAVARAVNGTAQEGLMIGADAAAALIGGFDAAIGDPEQAPPGIEDAIDPLLQRAPKPHGLTPFAHIPGSAEVKAPKPAPKPAAPDIAALTPEAKRKLAAALLKKRLAPAPN
jgi:hypothetical protein